MIVAADFAPIEASLPAHTRWVRTDIGEAGVEVDAFERIRAAGPLEQLRVVAGLADDAFVVGREPIRGRSTTHYRMRLPLGELLEGLRRPGATNDPVRFAVLRFDAWIDGRDRPVRTWLRITASNEAIDIKQEITSLSRRFRVGIPRGRTVHDITDLVRDDLP